MDKLLKQVNSDLLNYYRFNKIAKLFLRIIGYKPTKLNVDKLRQNYNCSSIIDKIIDLDEVCRIKTRREPKIKPEKWNPPDLWEQLQ